MFNVLAFGKKRERGTLPARAHFFVPAVEELESRRLLAAVARGVTSTDDRSDGKSLVLTATSTGTDFAAAYIWGGAVAGVANAKAFPAATIGPVTQTIVSLGFFTTTVNSYPGVAVTGAKFGPGGGTSRSLTATINNGVAAPNNTDAVGAGKWFATATALLGGRVTHYSADLVGTAKVNVGPGAGAPGATAVGLAGDPWIFTAEQSGPLTVEADVSDVDLEVSPDNPAQSGGAAFVADIAFGVGDEPGQNVLAEETYQVGITQGSFSLPFLTLMDQTFNLTAGTTYWETDDAITLTEMSSEPSTTVQTTGTATTTTLTAPAGSASYGQPLTLTAVVSGGNSSNSTPTGTVSFYDGETLLGAGTLDGTGTATLATADLPAGSGDITAVYGGDGNFAGSTSAPATVTVTQAATTTSVFSSINPATAGQPVTLDALVSTAGGIPTGAVAFYDGGTYLGTGTLYENGTASIAVPSVAAGDHEITAVYEGDANFTGSTSAPLSETVDTTPTVSGVSASDGPTAGGTSVTISGSGFSDATAVYFGGQAAANFTVNSDGSITAVSPAGSTGTVDVTVVNAAGTSATSSADQFTYVAAPVVMGISASSGPTAGGTTLTLSGSHFTGATAVYFGGTAAASFTVNSDNSITVVSPAGSGTVDITIVTAGGTSATVSWDQFTYVAPPPPLIMGISPSSGSTSGGTTVTIFGSHFTAATAVYFGGTAATSFTVNSDNSITVVSPAGSGTVDITIVTPDGISTTVPWDLFTYTTATNQ